MINNCYGFQRRKSGLMVELSVCCVLEFASLFLKLFDVLTCVGAFASYKLL